MAYKACMFAGPGASGVAGLDPSIAHTIIIGIPWSIANPLMKAHSATESHESHQSGLVARLLGISVPKRTSSVAILSLGSLSFFFPPPPLLLP